MPHSPAVKHHDKIASSMHEALELIAESYANQMVGYMKDNFPPPPDMEDQIENLQQDYATELTAGLKIDLLERWDAIVQRKEVAARSQVGQEYIDYIKSGAWLNDDE